MGIFFPPFFFFKDAEDVLGGKRETQGERRVNLAAPASGGCSALSWVGDGFAGRVPSPLVPQPLGAGALGHGPGVGAAAPQQRSQ